MMKDDMKPHVELQYYKIP